MLIGLAIAAITGPHLAPLIAAATVSANAAVLSPEFHKRSHMRPDESAPRQLLKDIGLVVSTKRHAKHHTQGHKSHYALLNRFTNVFLDGVKFKLTPGGPTMRLTTTLSSRGRTRVAIEDAPPPAQGPRPDAPRGTTLVTLV